jgi:hypothetical protein
VYVCTCCLPGGHTGPAPPAVPPLAPHAQSLPWASADAPFRGVRDKTPCRMWLGASLNQTSSWVAFRTHRAADRYLELNLGPLLTPEPLL